MTEEKAVSLLQKGKPEGLRWLMDRYAPYVSTVAWSILRGRMSRSDAEEVASDVFFALWQARKRLRPETLKGYLAAIARTRAINKLREHGLELTVEDDAITIPADDPAKILEDAERNRAVREVVHSMEPPDNEVFVRYYYYCQTAEEIAVALGMTPASIRQRLKRGRDRLREKLMKGEW